MLLECACLDSSRWDGNLAGQNTIERHVREDPTWFPVLLWDGLVAGPIRASSHLTSNQYSLRTIQSLECPAIGVPTLADPAQMMSSSITSTLLSLGFKL